jgi:ketosteroid isomerase-like protein
MAVENEGIVGKPLQVREQSRRTLDQRLALRFPPLASAIARLFGKLPPTARVRQALLARAVRLNAEAFNRRDFRALLLSYHQQAEFRAPRILAESNILQTSYRGYDGYVEFFREWLSAWGDYRMRPSEVIDLGDRIVVFDEIVGRGATSGAPLIQEHALVLFLKDGRVILSEEYFDPAEALEAVGLRE